VFSSLPGRPFFLAAAFPGLRAFFLVAAFFLRALAFAFFLEAFLAVFLEALRRVVVFLRLAFFRLACAMNPLAPRVREGVQTFPAVGSMPGPG